jgi:hypothetical protein
MTKSRIAGLVLMAAGGCAFGTAPDWLALPTALLGLAVTLVADGYHLRFAIARRQFGFLDRSRDPGDGARGGCRDLRPEVTFCRTVK